MNSQTFNITGEDFRDAFKREQDALRIERESRQRELAIKLDAACESFSAEYRATFEAGRSEADREAELAADKGQDVAERLIWLYQNVVADTNQALQDRKAMAEFCESALESISEAIEDRERSYVIEASAHFDLFRLHSVDVPALAQARVAEMRARIAALPSNQPNQ